jgi:hypothetical protein
LKKVKRILGRPMEVRRESVVVSKGDYARVLGTLKRQGKEKSEEYKEVLESYMRHSCALMCEKYEAVSRISLVEMKGITMMSKVLPDVLLQELYGEVLLACAEAPVAISQSHEQVFMHEVPGHVIGEVGLEGGPCKLLNIFLKQGLGVLWPRHKYCKIMLLQTDSIPVEEWKGCTYHLDFSGDTLDKIASTIPSMRPVFMIMPFGESGAKLDVGYHGQRLPRSRRSTRTKSIKKGSVLVVSSFQWHRTARPSAVEKIDQGVRRGPKRLEEQCFVCSSDLRLHICIGPELEYVNPHEATVAV